MWDEILLKKDARTSRYLLSGKSAMKRTVVPTVCLLVLLLGSVSSQSFANNRAQTISNIFQIPIQTLTAISNFAQNTRPLGEILQRRRNTQTQQQILSTSSTQPYYINSYSRSRAAKVAGLYTASDGSGFRI